MKCMAHESGGEAPRSRRGAAAAALVQLARNIRELRSTLRTALAICDDRIVRFADLPATSCRPQLQVPADSGQERGSDSIHSRAPSAKR